MATLRNLALASVASLILAGTAHATDYYSDGGHWLVWSAQDGPATSTCYLKTFTPTRDGEAAFVVVGGYHGRSPLGAMFGYQEHGWRWTTGGTVTIQVAPYSPWTFHNMSVNPYYPDMLFLWSTDGTANGHFFEELNSGESLAVTTPVGTRVFSLAGEQPALSAFGRCLGDAKRLAAQPSPRLRRGGPNGRDDMI